MRGTRTRPWVNLSRKVRGRRLRSEDEKSRRDSNGSRESTFRKPWAYSELETVWRNPSMTAGELAEMLPGRTGDAVRAVRKRYGRYRAKGVTPLCQKCGEHPVDMLDREARRWGLCKACAVAEKEWRDRNADELRRRNDARRQRRHNSKGR